MKTIVCPMGKRGNRGAGASVGAGMSLLNLPAAYQNMVVGGVLVLAVYLDQLYRRNVK